MERYTMFLYWKNQHCENDSTTQSNLQIQCNPYQTTTDIFHRTRTKNFTICMETQKTLNSQSNLENEKWSWRAYMVVQWLRICLPMQGKRDRALVWEDPTCRGATKPVRHNYWACASGPCAPQREAAIVRGPRTAMKSGRHLPQLEKSLAQKRRPNTAKSK